MELLNGSIKVGFQRVIFHTTIFRKFSLCVLLGQLCGDLACFGRHLAAAVVRKSRTTETGVDEGFEESSGSMAGSGIRRLMNSNACSTQ